MTGGTPATITQQATAAYAGRAQVRVFLGKWTEAVADAGQVAIDVRLQHAVLQHRRRRAAQSHRVGDRQHAVSRAHAVEHLVLRLPPGDEAIRACRSRSPTLQGDAAIECCGKVPFYPEAKHSTSASPIRLASGREMRLIEAEAKLRANDVAGAMTLINAVRTNAARRQRSPRRRPTRRGGCSSANAASSSGSRRAAWAICAGGRPATRLARWIRWSRSARRRTSSSRICVSRSRCRRSRRTPNVRS